MVKALLMEEFGDDYTVWLFDEPEGIIRLNCRRRNLLVRARIAKGKSTFLKTSAYTDSYS